MILQAHKAVVKFGNQAIDLGEVEIAIKEPRAFFVRKIPAKATFSCELLFSRCMFCRRPLRGMRARRLGYGPRCGRIHAHRIDFEAAEKAGQQRLPNVLDK